jgi:uncharacterized protein
MKDSAHDMEHVYRVLNYALEIARYEADVKLDVLITACLLHDIGREEQYADQSVDHAACGADKAYYWLRDNGYTEDFASEIKRCIETHRFRSDLPPDSLEAKILFDADKLDVCGAMGIARTLFYTAIVSEPLYSLTESGSVSDGTNDSEPSFFQEYKYKLEKIYDNFYTKRGSELAGKRKKAAVDFYTSLLAEVHDCYSIAHEN